MRVFRKFALSFVLLVCSMSLAHGEAMDVSSSSPELVTFCASARETDTDMNITIREDGSISGEFFMSECGSGPLFGYAQINIDSPGSSPGSSGGAWWGKLFIYTDILGGCLVPGAFYSVDVPDLLYRWHAGPGSLEQAGSLEMSGAGILELLECDL